MDCSWQDAHSTPDSETVVDHDSLNEELTGTSKQEVEEPLLCSVGSVMQDVASSETSLIIEVFLSVPCSVLHLWNSHTFSVCKSHVLHISGFVVSKASSYWINNRLIINSLLCLPLVSIVYIY